MRRLSLLCLLFVFIGCAPTFDGVLREGAFGYVARRHGPPLKRLPASVYIEAPTITDEDEEKDFGAIAEPFAASLRHLLRDYLCDRHAFDMCTQDRPAGAFRLSSEVVVKNYRPARGYAILFLGGWFLPPLLGLAWSWPVGLGTSDIRVGWTLRAPEGPVLWTSEESLSDLGWIEPQAVVFSISAAVERALPGMLQAAEKSLAEAQARPQPAPAGPGADARPVLAVFDVQDVAGRFDDQTLVQLTAMLSTSLASSGKFTVVPRAQIRDRLADEKHESYKACYDEACQIELGKAVSAQLTLATQLLKVDAACAVVANLYDLKSETTAAAAKVKTACEAGALLDAMEKLAAELAAKRR